MQSLMSEFMESYRVNPKDKVLVESIGPQVIGNGIFLLEFKTYGKDRIYNAIPYLVVQYLEMNT